jgi:hypothetical protein
LAQDPPRLALVGEIGHPGLTSLAEFAADGAPAIAGQPGNGRDHGAKSRLEISQSADHRRWDKEIHE